MVFLQYYPRTETLDLGVTSTMTTTEGYSTVRQGQSICGLDKISLKAVQPSFFVLLLCSPNNLQVPNGLF